MKTNNQIILKKKKGQWWNIATNKPFSGLASVNGQTFLYTKDGRKIPQSKPAPNIHNFIKNLWMRENPENKGFTNGKYYYYQTTNGNWDIDPDIDKAKQTNVNDMANESKVYFWDNKKKAMSFDKKRFDTRMKENFHYRNGGHLSRKALRLLSKDFRTINHLA